MRAKGARPLSAVRPREIREHGGRQDRAWEELAYQVAADMDGVPAVAVWERRGTPDGGIEFSCVFDEGANRQLWAWQAKYLFALTLPRVRPEPSTVEHVLLRPAIRTHMFACLPGACSSIAAARRPRCVPASR